jgi:hypothetical protein
VETLLEKEKVRARRRRNTINASRRQFSLLKTVGTPKGEAPEIREDELGRLAKHHALEAGTNGNGPAPNPRHNPLIKGDSRLTRQELRLKEALKDPEVYEPDSD